jgi:hypothetical protein
MLYSAYRRPLSVLGSVVFSLILSHGASASTVVVTNTTACKALPSYPTISQAVSSVPSGSTIYVCPGTYPEQVVIRKSLTLIGVGWNGLSGASAMGAENPVIISPTGGVVANATDLYNGAPIAAQIFVQTPSASLATPIKVVLEYIAIDGSNNQLSGCSAANLTGIYYQNASGTINQVVTRYQEMDPSDFGCQLGLAIFVESGYGSGGTATVTIENSSVHDYDKNGITVDGGGTIATITGNYVVGIGATSLIAQNGIQVSDGATGSVKGNTVTDDVYINPPDCSATAPPYCYGGSGILIYDSGGTSATSPLTTSGNTVSNTQLAIVAYSDGSLPADYNVVTSNKITTTRAAGIYLDDGIDLCSNNDMAQSNTVFNSSGSGIHIDSSCTEGGSPTGNGTTVTKNTINEACAGVLLGNGTSSQSGNIFYNVVQTTQAGDTCPTGSASAQTRVKVRLKPSPRRP